MIPTEPYFPLAHKDTHTPAYPCCFTSPSLSTTCCLPSCKQLVTERHNTSQHYHHIIITILGVTSPGDMAAKGNIGGILGNKGGFFWSGRLWFLRSSFLYAFKYVLLSFEFCVCILSPNFVRLGLVWLLLAFWSWSCTFFCSDCTSFLLLQRHCLVLRFRLSLFFVIGR